MTGRREEELSDRVQLMFSSLRITYIRGHLLQYISGTSIHGS